MRPLQPKSMNTAAPFARFPGIPAADAAFRLVAPLAAAVFLPACNLAPKYAAPSTPAPASFKEASSAPAPDARGWKLAAPGDDRIRAKWWEIYHDPVLGSLEERLQGANQTVAAAEANYRAARALALSATSALYPTVSASPSFTRQRTSTNTASKPGPLNPYNLFEVPVDVSYTLDLWDRLGNTAKAAEYSAQASAADLATALLGVQAELAQDYFEVRALDEERKILNETVASYRKDLDLTMSLYESGIDSEEDVATARTQLDTVIAQATDVGVARAQYEHALAVLSGKAPAEFSLGEAPFVAAPPSVPLTLPSTLLERRPDIAAAERLVAAANAQIGVARTAYFPNFTLGLSGGFESANLSQLFNWPSRFWSVGPQMTAVLFENGALRAVNEQARAAYDQSVANYRQTVLGAFQAVEDNVSALRILAEESVQQQKAVESAKHYLDLALTRYKAGIDSYLNVETAQTTVLTNRETALQIELREMSASVALVMALGGGWDTSLLPGPKKVVGNSGN
jgi:NodT family efflux transporter outer membrane factor (OMF) lipoprotein